MSGLLLKAAEQELEEALHALAEMLDSGLDVTAAHQKTARACPECSVHMGERIACPALSACLLARRVLKRE